jgi:hypothetical protein
VRIGNFLLTAPGGIAFVIDDAAAFVVDTGAPYYAGTAAPDDSFHHCQFAQQEANVQLDWGRVGDGAVARLTSDKAIHLSLRLSHGWPGWKGSFTPTESGVRARADVAGRVIEWQMQTAPPPIHVGEAEVVVALTPGEPVRIVAGLGASLPAISQVDGALDYAHSRYAMRRPAATGDWGDFIGAIADNVNNSRIYSSDNHCLAHSVSRGWSNGDPNKNPYFCWDSFFTADLACLDDPKTARATVRAILSYQTPEGLVPNFAHWVDTGVSIDRSQPPVGALCVWKMHQRWPDRDFLEEVYPKLAQWHEWWLKARDGNRDGLLEWGSATGDWQNAQYETGWDDNLHFAGTKMAGATMNANAVDLSSLWSMDAEYLSYIARAIGRKRDAAQFRSEHDAMNRRINEHLWNEKLGLYCSRFWGQPGGTDGEFLTRITPMNFYPLIAGVPDSGRAKQVMAALTDPHRFWGTWVLPTLAYDDPDYHQQEYWRGDIWGPVNYLVFQGLQRYASPEQRTDFARKSVTLFMKNWAPQKLCGENYLSTDGAQNRDPHYTWGALLDLIGVENICDVQPDGAIRLNGAQTQNIHILRLPINGRLYEVDTQPGRTELRLNGKIKAVATDK